MTSEKKESSTEKRARSTRKQRQSKGLPRIAPMADNSSDKRDVFDSAKRSEIMSKVHSFKNASTELKMIEVFKQMKIVGWRRHDRLFGRPDFLFRKLRIVVFVDGCFWHGHNCRNTKPKDNADYWRMKIERNRARDLATTEHLQALGYVVIRIWECDLKKKNAERLALKLQPLVEARAHQSSVDKTQEGNPSVQK